MEQSYSPFDLILEGFVFNFKVLLYMKESECHMCVTCRIPAFFSRLLLCSRGYIGLTDNGKGSCGEIFHPWNARETE